VVFCAEVVLLGSWLDIVCFGDLILVTAATVRFQQAAMPSLNSDLGPCCSGSSLC